MTRVGFHRRNKQTESKVSLTSVQDFVASPNEGKQENAMDLKSTSIIIGKPQMSFEIWERIFERKNDLSHRKLNKHMGGLSETACFWTTSRTIKINCKAAILAQAISCSNFSLFTREERSVTEVLLFRQCDFF